MIPVLISIRAENILSNINFLLSKRIQCFIQFTSHFMSFKHIDTVFMCENVLNLNKYQRQKYHCLVKCEHF